MDRDLVEARRWISRQDYVEGLAFSQLSPGPLAAQLAMYIGWVKAGRIGAALVAIAFIAPSFLMAAGLACAGTAWWLVAHGRPGRHFRRRPGNPHAVLPQGRCVCVRQRTGDR